MATIPLIIPDEHLTRVIDAVSGSFGYQAEIDGLPNPETKAAYSKRKIAAWLKNLVLTYEQQQARAAAGNDIVEVDITA